MTEKDCRNTFEPMSPKDDPIAQNEEYNIWTDMLVADIYLTFIGFDV